MTLEQAVQTIAIFQPKSIFLYGSQARGDVTSDSDVEIGVIVDTYTSLSRQQLKEAVNDPSYSIYPFNLSELLSYSIDTPFQKHFYLYELIVSAKTLYGEPIIERLSLPKISLLDALQDTRFNLWYALSATLVYRSGNRELAKSLFYKSCLYGTRSLILLRQGKFPIGYPEIFEASKKLELGEFAELVQAALEIRMGKREYDEMWLYKNIKYLNSFVEPQLMKEFSVKGNVMLLPSNLKNVVNLGKE